MNDVLFHTDGSWETTTLHNNGYEVPAAQLFVELRAGRDEWGEPISGGVFEGADLTAYIRPEEMPDNPFDIFPGRLTMEFPNYKIVLENFHPGAFLDHLRVFLNGEDVTDRVIDTVVDINAFDDVVSAWISVYKSRWFRRDEVITHAIIG